MRWVIGIGIVILLIIPFTRLPRIAAYLIQEPISHFKKAKLHEQAYQTTIRPAADWVRAFHAKEGRLPAEKELDDYGASQKWFFPILIYSSPFRDDPPWKRPGVDFVLCVDAGDWNLYYQSWDRKEFKYWTD